MTFCEECRLRSYCILIIFLIFTIHLKKNMSMGLYSQLHQGYAILTDLQHCPFFFTTICLKAKRKNNAASQCFSLNAELLTIKSTLSEIRFVVEYLQNSNGRTLSKFIFSITNYILQLRGCGKRAKHSHAIIYATQFCRASPEEDSGL